MDSERILTTRVRPALRPERLTSGDGEPVIVTDFLPFSGAPRLSQVIAGEAHSHPVYAVDPVADLAGCGAFVPLAELAAGYADALAAAAPAAAGTVVIGYCAAAALALRITARLARPARPARPARVLTILARPTWPDTAMINADMAGFRAGLGVTDGSPDDLNGDPGVTLRRLERILRADMRAMARAHGLDESASAQAELLGRYRAWLGFLLASRTALEGPWRPSVPVDVLTGASEPAAVPGLGPGSYAVTRLALPDDERLAAALLARSALALICDWPPPGDRAASRPEG